MRTSLRDEGLVISDSPGCFWVFGAFFCAIGGTTVVAVLATPAEVIPAWQTLAGVFMGLMALGVGLFVVYRSPGSRVAIHPTERTVTISRRGLLRRQSEEYDLAAVECVYLLQGKDIDSDPVYSLRMMMRGGQEVPLTLLWLHGKDDLTTILEQIGQFIPSGGIRTAGS